MFGIFRRKPRPVTKIVSGVSTLVKELRDAADHHGRKADQHDAKA